ncbi:MAG: glutamate synthase subunit beta [Candidatus Omnitrophota bacterium]
MVDIRGFLKIARQNGLTRPVCERIRDFKEVTTPRSEGQSREQVSRCMDCATPFCHWGCPIGNFIPEWSDYTAREKWEEALTLLDATNNLPEITGRVCPAPCESACVLGLNDDPVTIRENELAVIEYGFKKGWLKAEAPRKRTGKRVAVVGSGPAGLSCAAQLNKAGHHVVVFERDRHPGGILRYGIPDFKLEKYLIERRVALWKQQGIIFKTGIDVGKDYPVNSLLDEFDAICLSGGSRQPRDLKIEGRELKGIYFAMDYLIQANKKISAEKLDAHDIIDAQGKKVVVIGGGDTGADCVGTAHRQGAACVVQIEVLPEPPQCRSDEDCWPKHPLILKKSSSHEEGGERHWAVFTKRFIGEKGMVKKLSCLKEAPGSEFEIQADLVILAIGFLHPEHSGLLANLKVELDARGNVKTGENYLTSVENIFCAGDMRRGQSLVVWAIAEGRRAAYYIDQHLMGKSYLPNL